MTKLCRCGHKKTDHTPDALDRLMGRANCFDNTPCHAKTDHRQWDECMCLEFWEVVRKPQ